MRAMPSPRRSFDFCSSSLQISIDFCKLFCIFQMTRSVESIGIELRHRFLNAFPAVIS